MHSRFAEHVVEHGFRQFAGLCVLLAGMIGGDEPDALIEYGHASVREYGQW